MRKLLFFVFLLSNILVAEESLVLSHNRFAISLYNQKKQTPSNFFFSPFSIYTALGALYFGAENSTKKEIQAVLQTHLDKDLFAPAYQKIAQSLQLENFHSANALWLEKTLPLLPSYTQYLTSYLQTSIFPVDFLHDSDEVAMDANAWISKKTSGKITGLIQKKDLTQDTRLLLVNAVYFLGGWSFPFQSSNTQKDFFYTSSHEKQEVSMMSQEHNFPYYEENGLQIVALPIKNSTILCLLVLPTLSLDSISLSAESLSHWMNHLCSENVYLKVPKFTFSSRLDLEKTLASMGMKKAFSSTADFSSIDGERDLFVSKMLHQSYIRFEETGIEAAAATAVIMNMTTCWQKNPPIFFEADHPFLFLLVDKNSQVILFMGKVENAATK